MSRRFLIASSIALVLTVTACGDDDPAQQTKPVSATFELSGSGKQAKLNGPESIEAGLVRIEFTNSSKERGGIQLFRGTEGHSGIEAREAAAEWGDEGEPLPEWVKIEGGTPWADPGKTSFAVQELPAGDYMAVDFDSNARTRLKVTGGAKDAKLPSGGARIEATEYRFTATGLKAGVNTVEFANVGKQPHFFAAVPFKRRATVREVREYLRNQEGESPLVEDEGAEMISAVLDGGGKQVIELDLEKGRYALGCFVPDRAGGPPHAFKGMISEAVVE